MFGSFHFRNFGFLYFGHFSCVIFFKFVSVLNYCLAYLALLSKKKVNKHDYVIFSYFRNFIDQNEKRIEKLNRLQINPCSFQNINWLTLNHFVLMMFNGPSY